MSLKSSIKVVTAPTAWAVSLAEVRSQLRSDSSDDDTYVTRLFKAAQYEVESYTNRKLEEGKYELNLSEWPDAVVLPYSPIKTVESIKYYDGDGNQQTLSTDAYMYNIYEEPCCITVKSGYEWPTLHESTALPITVQFTTGYTSPAVIPEELKQAILLLVTDLYENRESAPRDRFSAWMRMAYPHRVFHDV